MASRPGDRHERAEVVLVAARRGRQLVGEPLFSRGEQVPLARGRVKVEEGEMALCKVDRRGGQPIRSLGRADRARDVVAALLAERGLRPGFSRRLEDEAREAIERLERDAGPRRDLISEPTFTVDPASARDFDDAVSARREGDGFRLWIHIADVAAHVKPEGGLDREARKRANSTYAPGIVSPMLPKALSNEACSLNPGVERLAVTSEIELGPRAEVRSASFYRSRIRSDVRLDYDELDRIFSGAERAPDSVSEPIAVARVAAAALADNARGQALTVHSSEPDFEFDDEGHVSASHIMPETEAHRLIEKLMILTNEQVATLLERKGAPALYRVHEQPDPARIELLFEQLGDLDVPTPPLPEQIGPTEAGELAAEASVLVSEEAKRRGHGAASLSSLVLRSLKPARYSDANIGHAGLASPAYSHFTSPIRRYPDLVAHRALLALVGEGEARPNRHELDEIALHCSDTERDSMKTERKGDDICLGFLLQSELFQRGWDQEFEGEVSGVIGGGAFIRFAGEMADAYEGFIPMRKLRGDHYDLNETESALVGSRTGRRLGFGDPIKIRVESVEPARGRVDLLLADGNRRDGTKGGRDGGRRQGGQGGGARSAVEAGKHGKKKGKKNKDKGKPERARSNQGRKGKKAKQASAASRGKTGKKGEGRGANGGKGKQGAGGKGKGKGDRKGTARTGQRGGRSGQTPTGRKSRG